MSLHIILQLGILVPSATAIFLLSGKRRARWGYLFGMASQPFWIASSLMNEQWGIFILSLFYTFNWTRGIWNYWIKDE